MIISCKISHIKISLDITVPGLTGATFLCTIKAGLEKGVECDYCNLLSSSVHSSPLTGILRFPTYTTSIVTAAAWKEDTNIQSLCNSGILDRRNEDIMPSFLVNQNFWKVIFNSHSPPFKNMKPSQST